MAGNGPEPTQRTGDAFSPLFCRHEELLEITKRMDRADCSAIFISSEMGMGATTLLHELRALESKRRAVIALHGTPSLASIPFGILGPYLRRSSSSFVESHVDAVRKLLGLIEEDEAALREMTGMDADLRHPLLILDEADHIDRATAEVMSSLVRAGRLKLVIAHPAGSEPARPMPRLWEDGLVERVHLRPLSRETGHDFCTAVLGGRPAVNISWHFWNMAGGNPLLMKLVMDDAVSNGILRRQDGRWVMELHSGPSGRQLQEVVLEQLRGLSPTAREMLDLVALSEPVPVETIIKELGATALAELMARHLLQETMDDSGVLKLANPVYGEVIRELVPRAHSRMLHARLVKDLETEPKDPESLLRMVIWALDSGHDVPDVKLVSAAIFACKLYESEIAMRLAGMVKGTDASRKASVIKARVMFNMGQYEEAAQLLDTVTHISEGLSELMFGGLLLAATRSALGLPAQSIHDDASRLRIDGEKLAARFPDDAPNILWRTRERAEVLDLMALSRSGRYEHMGAHIAAILGNTDADDDPDHLCNRSLALAFDAERLSAIGKPMSARSSAGAAFAIEQEEDHNVYFVPEMIITRAQVASLTAGTWQESEQMLQYFAVDLDKVTVSFGGSVDLVRGMMMLRQGKNVQAFEVLSNGAESLKHSDPQQLLGYCTAMAAYAAVKSGRVAAATEFLEQYREDPGMYIVVAHERAFIAAAHEHLDGNGAGLKALLQIADDCSQRGLLTAELNALSLAMDFDSKGIAKRTAAVAHAVEGSWAAGLAAYAQTLGQRNAEMVVDAAEHLLEAQMYHHAGRMLRAASSLMSKEHKDLLSRRVKAGMKQWEDALAGEGAAPGAAIGGQRRAQGLLTRRELEISLMAAEGMTDKDIASMLHVSVRTVEGHLYRSYSKLGITDRNDLALTLSD